jgi:hypothetical protein
VDKFTALVKSGKTDQFSGLVKADKFAALVKSGKMDQFSALVKSDKFAGLVKSDNHTSDFFLCGSFLFCTYLLLSFFLYMEHLFWIKKEVDIDLRTQIGQDDVMKRGLDDKMQNSN